MYGGAMSIAYVTRWVDLYINYKSLHYNMYGGDMSIAYVTRWVDMYINCVNHYTIACMVEPCL